MLPPQYPYSNFTNHPSFSQNAVFTHTESNVPYQGYPPSNNLPHSTQKNAPLPPTEQFSAMSIGHPPDAFPLDQFPTSVENHFPQQNHEQSKNQLQFLPLQQPPFPPSQQSSFPPSQQPSFPPSQQPSFPPSQQPSFLPSQQPSFPPSQQPPFPPSQQPPFPSHHQDQLPPKQMNFPGPPVPTYPSSQQAPNPPNFYPNAPGYPPVSPGDTDAQSNRLPATTQMRYMNRPAADPPQPFKKFCTGNLPSAVEVAETNRAQFSGLFCSGQRSVVPPLVTTNFACRDEGNCNPRFIRSSLYAIPTTSDLMKTVGIPFTLTISPFATLHSEDQPIILSDMGVEGPVRCARCRAYMNPFASFIDGGRRFQCPFCNGLTDVPASYFAHLDHTGRRTDICHRPELCLGSYELTATAEYCKNNEFPKPPALIFLLDVSQTSIRSGLVHLFCSQFVNHILPMLPRDEDDPHSPNSQLKIGFITYNHQLHFYSFIRGSDVPNGVVPNGTTPSEENHSHYHAKPQMHIVGDIEDVFVPAVEGFLVPPDPSLIDSLLRLVPTEICSEPAGAPPDAVLGPAIQAGLEALRAANRSGKLFVFHSNLPTADGPGKLKNRDERRLIGTEKEKSLLVPVGDFYTGLASLCVESGCSVDLFLFPNAFTDVATLAEISKVTGGHLYKYNCFQADLQGSEFIADLKLAVARPKAFNAVMRVRTSTGIRPVEFYGNCRLQYTTDIELACADPDTSITVEIRHDDKLQDNDVAFVQVACLYTSLSGKRKLRIHNLSLATTSSIPEMFRLAELDTHMNWMSKFVMRSLCNRAHPHVVDDLNARVAHTLVAYRRHCFGGAGEVGASPCELVLPQNMKLYPLYVQCLMKTDACAPADNISIDERAFLMFLVNGMDVKQTNAYLYPRLYPVHNLSLNADGKVTYPPPVIRCSHEWLVPEGAYLLDNGVVLFLWLGPNISADWIQAVFGVPSARHFEPEKIYDLPQLASDVSRALCYLIDMIRLEHSRTLRLFVVRSGDKLEGCFRRFLVEDRHSGNSVSYAEYLCHIHKEVRGLSR